MLPDGTTGGANSELSDEPEDAAFAVVDAELSALVEAASSLELSFSLLCVIPQL